MTVAFAASPAGAERLCGRLGNAGPAGEGAQDSSGGAKSGPV